MILHGFWFQQKLFERHVKVGDVSTVRRTVTTFAAVRRQTLPAAALRARIVYPSSLSLELTVFGPAASVSAAGTCSTTVGSFLLMFGQAVCWDRLPEFLL
jgi:hypothetical protein